MGKPNGQTRSQGSVDVVIVLKLSSDGLWDNLPTEGEVTEIAQAALQAAEIKNPRAVPTMSYRPKVGSGPLTTNACRFGRPDVLAQTRHRHQLHVASSRMTNLPIWYDEVDVAGLFRMRVRAS